MVPPLISPAPAEHQQDHHRGHRRAQQDAPPRGLEGVFHHPGKALTLAPLLPEALDDLHRREHLGDIGADIGDAILAAARNRADAPPEIDDRGDHQRNADEQAQGERGGEEQQQPDAADRGERIAQRHRDRGAHQVLDDRGVARHPAGDFLGAVDLVEAGREAQQVFLHLEADIGHHPLAQPADEVEAQRRADAEDHHDHQQIFKGAADLGRAGRLVEGAVDDDLEAIGNGEGCRRGDDEGGERQRDLARVGERGGKHHPQGCERAPPARSLRLRRGRGRGRDALRPGARGLIAGGGAVVGGFLVHSRAGLARRPRDFTCKKWRSHADGRSPVQLCIAQSAPSAHPCGQAGPAKRPARFVTHKERARHALFCL
jgi:hypothetical protein